MSVHVQKKGIEICFALTHLLKGLVKDGLFIDLLEFFNGIQVLESSVCECDKVGRGARLLVEAGAINGDVAPQTDLFSRLTIEDALSGRVLGADGYCVFAELKTVDLDTRQLLPEGRVDCGAEWRKLDERHGDVRLPQLETCRRCCGKQGRYTESI